MSDRLGQQCGNYRLISLSGQGGYAEVYLHHNVSNSGTVLIPKHALKATVIRLGRNAMKIQF
jgi:hypothetical protein